MYSVYIGSYQIHRQPGIHHLLLDETSGHLRYVQGVAGIENPSYLAWSAPHHRLFSVQESETDPRIYALYIGGDDSRLAVHCSQSQATSGGLPCYLSTVTSDGVDALLVANYAGPTVDWFPLTSDGSMHPYQYHHVHLGKGRYSPRQATAHPHSIITDPSHRYALVPDLGLDSILVYRISPQSPAPLQFVTKIVGSAGSGPRLMVFHPWNPYFYVVNELDASVSVYYYQSDFDRVEQVQQLASLPLDYNLPNSAAHIVLGAQAKRLYVSNRGHNSIAVFAVEDHGARLDPLTVVPTQAKIPRHFTVTPDCSWLIIAGQGADLLEVMAINDRGIPVPLGYTYAIPRPTCVAVIDNDHNLG